MALISFVPLGIDTFFYVNANRVGTKALKEFGSTAANLTVTNTYGVVPEFQQQHYFTAKSQMDTFDEALTIAVESGRSRVSDVETLVRNALALLQVYGMLKHLIPLGSKWFQPEIQFPSWMHASATDVGLSWMTGYQLSGIPDQDYQWLEKRVAQTIESALMTMLERGDIAQVVRSLTEYIEVVGSLSRRFLTDEALTLLDVSRHLARQITGINRESATVGGHLSSFEGHAIELVDIRGLATVSLGVSLANRIREIELAKLRDATHAIDWGHESGIYHPLFPRPVVARLTEQHVNISFEIEAEGTRVTPDWYIDHQAGAGFAEFLGDANRKVLSAGEAMSAEVAYFRDKNHPLLAAQLIMRAFEACAKCDVLLEVSQELAERVGEMQNSFCGPFEQFDWTTHKIRIDEARRAVLLSYGSISDGLARRDWTKQRWPDYLGHAYRLLLEATVSCLVEGRVSEFSGMWNAFVSTLRAFGAQPRPRIAKDPNWQFVEVTESTIDIVALSGLAIAIAELGGSEVSNVVLDYWNDIFDRAPDQDKKQDLAQYIARLVVSRSNPLTYGPRHATRSNWKRSFEDLLQEKGLINNDLFNPWERRRRKPAPHASPLVCAIVYGSSDFGIHCELEDIFVASYLVLKREFGELPMTNEATTLVERMRKGWQDDDWDYDP